MLTSSQLRAARALTDITVDALADMAGLSADTIRRLEAAEGHSDAAEVERLKTIYEAKGVIFIAAGDGDGVAGPGVRLRQQIQEEGIRPQNLNAANDG